MEVFNCYYRDMKKRGKIIAGFIFALIVVIVALEASARSDTVVRMDDNGFHPAKIIIQSGQSVRWINTGRKDRWPASNNHPTHTNYPTEEEGCLGSNLDACKNLKSGESYSFNFSEPGSWGMHDHLNPGSIMVVEVEAVNRGWTGKVQLLAKNLFNKKTANKLPTPEKFRTWDFGEQLSTLEAYARDDPKGAWEYLKSAFIVNGQVLDNPHELAHIVGAATYDKSGIYGVTICDPSFAYGCFHGVAEAAINDKGETAISEIEQACTDALSAEQAPSCYHGIGHGTAGIYNLEIPPALNACEMLEQSHQEYCYDGVFMEQAMALGSDAIDQAKPWELCGSLDLKFHIACGRYQPTRLQAAGLDFAKIIASCSPAPSDILEEHCFRSNGFAAASVGDHSVETIVNLCDNATNLKGKGLCLASAATETTFQAYNGWQSTAPQLCDAITESDMKVACIQGYQAVAKREGR